MFKASKNKNVKTNAKHANYIIARFDTRYNLTGRIERKIK